MAKQSLCEQCQYLFKKRSAGPLMKMGEIKIRELVEREMRNLSMLQTDGVITEEERALRAEELQLLVPIVDENGDRPYCGHYDHTGTSPVSNGFFVAGVIMKFSTNCHSYKEYDLNKDIRELLGLPEPKDQLQEDINKLLND